MSKGKNHAPKQVTLSSQEADALKERIKNKNITNKDIDNLLGLIAFNLWLQERLSRAKLTIKKLQQLFGFKSESRKRNKKTGKDEATGDKDDAVDVADDNSDGSSTDENGDQEKAQAKVIQWDPEKNHGRIAANDYVGCPVINIPFDNEFLKAGQCPDCAACNTKANISYDEPKVLVFLDSQPLISGERYYFEKARCSLCKSYFVAPFPEDLEERPKYSFNCMTNLAIMHYYAGLPFKRIETLQLSQGVPLPDATQYDLMDIFYKSVVKPVVSVLRKNSANGNNIFFDDTTGRVLEQINNNKNANKKSDKKSVHTTALLSEYEGNRIYLFDTNTLTAGKQLADLLQDRTSGDKFITMSDASASNFPKLDDSLLARWVITLCLSHGRRRFYELLDGADPDTRFILDLIAEVYQNERHCKTEKLKCQERLQYHKKHSAPVMDAMRIWFNNLLLFKKVEPNSRLGEAITYMLKRWHWLTQFLRVPGAALDNNICEQAIKVVIRYRNNSLFYRTFYGASIGDAMMSLLHTAANAKVNIFDYLTTLQEYSELVQGSPENWLPWNYQQTRDFINEEASLLVNSN